MLDWYSTVKQIQQSLEEDYDKKLSVVTVRLYLFLLAKDTKIISEQTKSGNAYRVVGDAGN